MIDKARKKNKIVLYLAIVMLILSLLFFSKSYAYFETKVVGNNVTLGVGKLTHSLNSDVKLKVGKKKEIDLIVRSNDVVDSKYQVYYKSSDDLTNVLVGYANDSVDLPSGEIVAKGYKNITIVLENNSSNDVSVEIGVRGGLAKNTVEDIVLEIGENRVVNVMEGIGDHDLVCDTTATATSADITEGKTAWVNGELITGTRPAPVNSQSGNFTSGVLWKGDTYTYTVEFKTVFDAIPKITYTISNSNTSIPNSYIGVRIFNVTREGFSVSLSGNCPSGYSNSGIATFHWTAVVG